MTLAITEAALTDYAGMYFRGLPGTALEVVLPPWSDGSGVCVRGVTPFSSPWRVIMIGEKPGDLIESTLIQNLNAPCALEDVSWIRPGKAIFPWWPDFFSDKPGVASKMGFENQKYYIDFAAANDIAYLELEPPWYGDEKGLHRDPGEVRYHQAHPRAPAAGAVRVREGKKRAAVRLGALGKRRPPGRRGVPPVS